MNKLASYLAFFMVAGLASHASALDLYEKDDKTLKIIGIVQPRMDMNLDSTPVAGSGDEKGPVTTDFYIRRFRLITEANIHKNIQVRFNLHSNDIGLPGKYNPAMFVGDAYIEYKASKNLLINFGILKLPFLRHMMQGAAGLHGMDFHGFILKEPAGVKGAMTNLPHRDNGIMFRGLLANKKIDYRIAIVDGWEYNPGVAAGADGSGGAPAHNEEDMPRMVGRIAYNLFDATPEYYLAGTYLGKKKVVSFGVSFDLQPGVGGDDGKKMYSAFGGDLLVDLPMGKNGLTLTGNFGKFGEGGPMPGDKGGMGMWADLGYRIGKIEPLFAFEQYIPDNEEEKNHKGEHQAMLFGLNYWAKGHAFNIKAQFGMVKDGVGTGDGEEFEGKFKKHLFIQSQVRF
ncbi:OprO/OprP family phosphate-selective porin [Myxococcota bacterium]|nr:OprO/OprP family phosphate-selective porin [Myxococcota bacterium]